MNTVQTDSRHSSLEFDSEQYSPRVLIIVRITAVALLLAAAVAGVVLLSSLPSRADALAGIFNVAFVLKTMLIALTMLVLMFVAVWPKNKVPALQSLPGGGLIFLLAGLGLLFAYEALDVTRNIFGVESNTVLSITEEVLRFLGALALLGAVALWARGLSRARLQLLEEEQRSRQGKADYKNLFEMYPDPSLLIDPETARIVRFNHGACKQLGYTNEEFSGMHVRDFEAVMSPEEIEQKIRTVCEDGRDDFETIHRCKNGSLIDVQVSLLLLDKKNSVRLLAVFRNITDRKRTLRELAESEKRFADVAVAAGEYIWEIDTEGCYTDVTAPVEALLGYPLSNIIGHSPYEFMPEDEAERVKNLLRGYAADKSSWQGLEHVSVRSDGALVHQRVSGLPIISESGDLLGFRGAGRDITAEKNAEIAEKELSERLSLATESAGLGIWDYDLSSGRLEWDDRMFQLYGMNRADFGHSFEDWARALVPDSRELAVDRFQAAVESGNDFEVEISIRRADDGRLRILQGQAQIICNETGKAVRVVGVNRDVTEQVENERRLAAEEEKFRTLFELAPVGIAMNDFQTGEFLRFNAAVHQPAGYTHEEFAQLSYWDVTPKEYMAIEQAQLESMRQTGRYGPFQKEYVRKDGSRYPVRLSGFRFTTAEGREVIWSIIQDISEQQKTEDALRTAKERFEGIFEQTSSGVAVYHPVDDGKDFTFVDYNPAAEHMDGKKKDAVIGRPLTEVFPGIHDLGLLEVLQRVAQTGQPEELPLSQYEDANIMGWRENRVFRLSSGEVVAVYDDLTGIKRAQQESERARWEAEQASRAKSEFLANMSHEIRTPMNAVIGLSQLLMQTPLNELQQDHAKKIYHSSQMLLGIINDILNLSKIDSGKLELEERSFSLEEITEQMATLFAESTYSRKLEFLFDIQPDIPQALVGDSLRLSQVLTNLLSNAIKFTDPGGLVELGIRATNPVSSEKISLRFSVRDTGVGISAEDVARLFRPFTQVDSSTTRRHGGTGLGLMISQRLVEKMGGELTVESEPDRGSTFSFTLILPIGGACSLPSEAPRIRGGRALIVDDQAAAREVVRKLLHYREVSTEEAESGEAAIDKVLAAEQREQPFDFVLMDWNMPGGMNGSETCEALDKMRRKGELAQTGPPILMVSAFEKDEINLPKGLTADFLSKPVTASSVYSALMRVESGAGIVREPPSVGSPVPTLCGYNILLVEDNETNREVAQLLLEKTGAEISVVKNGAEALDAVASDSPDLIFMDLQMPVMDGFESMRALRDRGYTGPTIALSAAVMDDDRRRANEAGMDDHLAKPIESEQLYALLVKYLGERGSSSAQHDASASTAPAQVVTGSSAKQEFCEAEDRLESEDVAYGKPLLPEALPGFDLARGRKQLGGNKALYARQLRRFSRTLRSDYSSLVEALRSGHAERAKKMVHTLKGAAGTLAAEELERLAGEIEHILKQKLSVDSSLVDNLERALSAAERALQTLKNPHEPYIAGTAAAVETLRSRLEKNELVDETILRQALDYLRGLDLECDELERQVEQMDFETALRILYALKNCEQDSEK